MLHNRLLLIYSIRVVLIFTLLFASAVFVLAQDEPIPEPVSDMAIEEVVFVEGNSALDNFANNVLNDLRVLFLSLVLPAMGLVTVGTGLLKRFIPNKIPSDWIAFGIMGVLFGVYYLAGNLEQGKNLQVIVDFLTQVGGLLLVAGITKVGSSAFYNVAKNHDDTIIGYQRTKEANG